jgi:hypothetical protein
VQKRSECAARTTNRYDLNRDPITLNDVAPSRREG